MRVACVKCNKIVDRKPSTIGSRVFCSRKCMFERVDVQCLHCKKTKNVKKCIVHRYTYCSVQCRKLGAITNNTFKCEYCGKNFLGENRYNRKQKYCDQECLGAAIAILDYSSSFYEDAKEHLDGFLLGDGHLTPQSPHLSWSVRQKQFSHFIAEGFNQYQCSVKMKRVQDARLIRGETITYRGRSKCHPDLKHQRQRWYKDKIKVVPRDVILTPKSVMLWYLGDGHLSGSLIHLYTMAFSKDDVEFLIDRLNTIADVKCYADKHNNIIIPLAGIRNFFNFIGWSSPIKCYDYKFKVSSEIRYLKQTEEIAQDLKTKHHTVYNHGKRLFSNKKQSINGAFWWSPEEVSAIKQVLLAKGVIS